MRPRLIVNADDFGLTPGINRAIIELHQAGVVSSATLMANGPAFEDAISLAHANPCLGVGCHLVFVDGTPVSFPASIPTLLGSDRMHFRSSLAHFASASIRRVIRPADLARETRAQLIKLQNAGINVTHLDTHKHTHIFPSVARPIYDTAQSCGMKAMRYPFEPSWSSRVARASPLRRLQLLGLQTFASSFDRMIQRPHRESMIPCGTLGIAATGTVSADTLRLTLEAFLTHHRGAVYELCCHPGLFDAATDASKDGLGISREIEYRALLEVLPEMLRSASSPELIHYGML